MACATIDSPVPSHQRPSNSGGAGISPISKCALGLAPLERVWATALRRPGVRFGRSRVEHLWEVVEQVDWRRRGNVRETGANDGMPRALSIGMLTSTPTPVCPHCGSLKLTFLEHGSAVAVYQCELCGRATVQRWEPTPPAVTKPPVAQSSAFPDWFARTAQR